MENYSANDAYWYRRKAVEVFFRRVKDRVPDIRRKHDELVDLNRRITERSETVRFKCIYLFRDGQELNLEECDSRGGYADTWYRSGNYNLPKADSDDEDEVPMPGKPVKVELRPGNDTESYCGEFVECWHPNCQEYYLNHPLQSSPVIYMFCRNHADKDMIKAIHDFVLEGKPIENPEVSTLVDIIGKTIESRISSSIDSAIARAERTLETEEEPDKVLEVQCYAYLNENENGLEEETTYYVDRVSCIRSTK